MISLVLDIKGIKQDAVATFYSPQTRLWELLSGSLLAWFTLYKKNVYQSVQPKIDGWLTAILYREKTESNGSTLSNVLTTFGFILLIYGFWRITKASEFPGKWALVPVIGSVLIIAGGPKAWINHHLLSHKVAVWFGLISFPLYLWHWPLLSYARIIESGTPSREIRMGLVTLSIALSWLTYKTIERPIRLGGLAKTKLLVLVVLMLTIFATSFATHYGYIFRQTFLQTKLDATAKTIKRTDRAAECFEIPYAYKKEGAWYCDLGSKSFPTKYFAFGDSHALSLVPALEEYTRKHHINIEFAGTSGCPPLLGIQSMRGADNIKKNNCQALNERIFNHVKSQGIENVILIARWTYYTGSNSRPTEFNPISKNINEPLTRESSAKDFGWALSNTVSRYASVGVNVIFVEDNPQQILDPKDALREGPRNGTYARQSVSTEEHLKNQAFVNSLIRTQKAKVINFDDLLCSTQICPIIVGTKSIYFDDDHLSAEGAMLIYPRLESVLNDGKLAN